MNAFDYYLESKARTYIFFRKLIGKESWRDSLIEIYGYKRYKEFITKFDSLENIVNKTNSPILSRELKTIKEIAITDLSLARKKLDYMLYRRIDPFIFLLSIYSLYRGVKRWVLNKN